MQRGAALPQTSCRLQLCFHKSCLLQHCCLRTDYRFSESDGSREVFSRPFGPENGRRQAPIFVYVDSVGSEAFGCSEVTMRPRSVYA